MSSGIAFLALLFGLSLPSFGQSYKITWADETKVPKHEPEDIIGKHEGNLYVLQGLTSGYSFDYMLQTLEASQLQSGMLKHIPILEDASKKSSQYISSVKIDEQIYLYHSLYDKDKKENRLLMTKLDLQGNVDGPTMQLAMEPKLGRKYPEFQIIPSPDSMLFLVYTNAPEKEKEKDGLGFKVVFKNMQDVIWSNEVVLPYTSKELIKIWSLQVDNMGNVYILIEVAKDKSERQKKEAKNLFKILRFENPNGDLKEYDLDLGELTVVSADLKVDLQNNLNCAGFYQRSFRKEKGYFNVQLSGGGSLKKKSTIDLMDLYPDLEEHQKNTKTATEKSKKKELGYIPYQVHCMIDRDNGGHFVIAEQRRKYVTIGSEKTHTVAGLTPWEVYEARDVVVLALDAEGELEWSGFVPKYQEVAIKKSGMAGIMSSLMKDYEIYPTHSIVATAVNDKVYFIYNGFTEHVNYYTKKQLERKKRGKRAVLIATVEKGKVKKEVLFDKKDSKYVLFTDIQKTLDNGDIIFLGKKGLTGGKSNLGRVSFRR